MTDATDRLPDLLVRTTSRGERFGWRLVTTEGDRFLGSDEQAARDGSPADHATRAEARQAAGQVLLALVRAQAAPLVGEVVDAPTCMGPSRLAA
jgi:hypothetical protein